jgi:cytochrome oxidase Cu insertion factor (SCO1/SenC/PrrC family)
MRWRPILRCILGLIWGSIFCTQNTEFTWNQSRAEQTIFHAYAKPMRAPDFSLENLQGKMVDLKELRGQVILINFWATW